MGFLHRLGIAFAQYGIVGSILALVVLVVFLGYGQEEIMAEIETILSDDYLAEYEAEELSEITFELVLLLAPIPVFLYRFFAYKRAGLIGELVLFFIAGANPVLGVLGLVMYAVTSKQ